LRAWTPTFAPCSPSWPQRGARADATQSLLGIVAERYQAAEQGLVQRVGLARALDFLVRKHIVAAEEAAELGLARQARVRLRQRLTGRMSITPKALPLDNPFPLSLTDSSTF
jgi:hypothetical protein